MRIRNVIVSFFEYSMTEYRLILWFTTLLFGYNLILYFAIPTVDTHVLKSKRLNLAESGIQSGSENESELVFRFNEDIITQVQWKLHRFDPNRTTAREFYQMGFKAHHVDKIFDFKRNSGFFISESDFLKLFSPDEQKLFKPNVFLTPFHHKRTESKRIESKSEMLNLQTVTPDLLQTVPGIGPVLSKRIVKFRERLGGFYDVKQLYEVYGLDSSVAEAIISNSKLVGEVAKVSIQSPDSILSLHPYCDYRMAKMIFNFVGKREGATVQDLTMIYGIDAEKLHRLKPYLSN